MSERPSTPENSFTDAQEAALSNLCERYKVEYAREHYAPRFDLPPGYLAGWVGGYEIQDLNPTIFVGCSPEGEVSS